MKRIPLIVFLFLHLGVIKAQIADRQTVASSGDYFVLNPSYTFQCTIGEAVVQTLQAGPVVLTQGFQQPDQLIKLPIPSGGVPSDVTVYPNPAVDQVKVQFNLDAPLWIKLVLVNNAGQIVRQLPLSYYQAGLHEVPFDFHLASGLYLLTLYYDCRILTYKVIIQ